MPRGRPDIERDAENQEATRLDKWIWHARFLRSREASAELVRSGHVRLKGRRVTQPGHVVRPGDILTLALPRRTIIVEVLVLAERRGGASDAALLYRMVEGAEASAEP